MSKEFTFAVYNLDTDEADDFYPFVVDVVDLTGNLNEAAKFAWDTAREKVQMAGLTGVAAEKMQMCVWDGGPGPAVTADGLDGVSPLERSEHELAGENLRAREARDGR